MRLPGLYTPGGDIIDGMDDEDSTHGIRTACPTCGGQGHIHEPKLAVLGGQPQTVLAPRTCPQCGDLEEPGWLPGFVAPG